ncbi:hypothetical protein Kisp02_10080 [Kineosporia sp. NBRC 101731]|nr:hypothetical protein Kisp02_10080 [Kineosporia sp. NBRC 101731]
MTINIPIAVDYGTSDTDRSPGKPDPGDRTANSDISRCPYRRLRIRRIQLYPRTLAVTHSDGGESLNPRVPHGRPTEADTHRTHAPAAGALGVPLLGTQ